MAHIPWLRHDPRPALLAAGDPALAYWARRDLLDEDAGPPNPLWDLPEPRRLLRRQEADGAWPHPSSSAYPAMNHRLYQTYRTLSTLVDKYGMSRESPAIERAVAYCFACQTDEGDIRGILGPQTMPYYHGAILEVLIRAGYADDPRVHAGLEWLLAVRGNDGGWVVPLQAAPARDKPALMAHGPTLPPPRELPSSHLATGMALRAFAAHPAYRAREEARAAGRLLASRILKPDRYNDRKAAGYWTKLQYPFFWTSLLTALDTLAWLGFGAGDADVARGIDWFVAHQDEGGLWVTQYENAKDRAMGLWVALGVCRALRRARDFTAEAQRGRGEGEKRSSEGRGETRR